MFRSWFMSFSLTTNIYFSQITSYRNPDLEACFHHLNCSYTLILFCFNKIISEVNCGIFKIKALMVSISLLMKTLSWSLCRNKQMRIPNLEPLSALRIFSLLKPVPSREIKFRFKRPHEEKSRRHLGSRFCSLLLAFYRHPWCVLLGLKLPWAAYFCSNWMPHSMGPMWNK